MNDDDADQLGSAGDVERQNRHELEMQEANDDEQDWGDGTGAKPSTVNNPPNDMPATPPVACRPIEAGERTLTNPEELKEPKRVWDTVGNFVVAKAGITYQCAGLLTAAWGVHTRLGCCGLEFGGGFNIDLALFQVGGHQL